MRFGLNLVLVFVTAAAAPAEEKRTLAFSALIDGYYSWNGNRPASRANQLRLYDVSANAFRLSFVRLGLDREPDPLGFRVEIGAGRAYTLLHSADPAPRILDYLPQAYLKWKPGPLAGLQLNVWDNNRGKTIGLTAAVTGTKASWFHDYYAGPEKTGSEMGWRQLYDTTVLLAPRPRIAFYGNFDYGLARKLDGGADRWLGVAGAAQRLKESTVTAEWKAGTAVSVRLEYRRDWSDRPFFDRRGQGAAAPSQTTVLAGLIAFLSQMR